MRDVYASQPPPAFQPPTNADERKRRHSISDPQTDDAAADASPPDAAKTDASSAVPDGQGSHDGVSENVRPMKPLGSARRAFGKSVSMPVQSTAFASALSSAQAAQPPTVAETSMEADWSEADFSGSGFEPVRL